MPRHVFYILIHFFAVPCKTTAANDQIIGFEENMNTRRLIFLSLFELESRPHKINLLLKLPKVDFGKFMHKIPILPCGFWLKAFMAGFH